MTENDNPGTISLEPDWDYLASYFDQKAKDARQSGDEEGHAKYTELAEKAEEEDLSSEEVYREI